MGLVSDRWEWLAMSTCEKSEKFCRRCVMMVKIFYHQAWWLVKMSTRGHVGVVCTVRAKCDRWEWLAMSTCEKSEHF
jgi:hypothetical protein